MHTTTLDAAHEAAEHARHEARAAGAPADVADAIGAAVAAAVRATVGLGKLAPLIEVQVHGARIEVALAWSSARGGLLPPARSPASSVGPLAEGTVDSTLEARGHGGASDTSVPMARELTRVKEEVLAGIAHDLRSPLAAVKGALDVLLGGAAGVISDEQQRYLAIAERASRHVLALVSDLLDSSLLDAGLARLDVEDVDMVSFLIDLAAEYRVRAVEKQIAFVLEVPPTLPHVRADRRRLRQIVDNLLSNALKFTHPGGRVILAAGRRGDGLALRVADTGVGITGARLPHLFDKSRRRHTRGTRGERGTGLGLYICKRLVELLGGAMTVDSVSGRGTTFGVTLPTAQR